MLAKIVNDDAGILNEHGALPFFASKLAPTAMNDDAVCDQIALWLLSQPRPASVVVSGLYSQPTQPW
ncbi:hypothetical protein F2A37_08260 [Pseudomonas chlororaphis]|nr:hypothetical protein F2A37_08260 [Pseudomonas chlororaphis]